VGLAVEPLRVCRRQRDVLRGQSAAAEPGPGAGYPGGADAQGPRGVARRVYAPRPVPRRGPHLRVKEVYVGEGKRRRRYVVCHNPDEAAREQAHRARLLELVRAERAALDVRQADHPQKACELMASRHFGRYLRMDARGRLSIETTQVAAEAKYDGKFVVTTNDDTLDAADVALGYTSMMLSEGCCWRMQTTGLQTRPIYHWRPRRIIAHVKLCGLALLLERAAEIRCQQTWRTIRHTLDQLKVVRYQMHGMTIVQKSCSAIKDKVSCPPKKPWREPTNGSTHSRRPSDESFNRLVPSPIRLFAARLH
jgi:hypothetical protein